MRIDCRWIALLLLAACAGMRDPETGSNDSGSSGLLTITASADEVTVGDSPVTLTAAPGEASWSLLGPGKLSAVTGQTTQYLPPDSLDLTESVTVTASRGSDKARAVLKVHPRLSYPVGRRPVAIGFDGARLWVAGAWDLDVLILRPSDLASCADAVRTSLFATFPASKNSRCTSSRFFRSFLIRSSTVAICRRTVAMAMASTTALPVSVRYAAASS